MIAPDPISVHPPDLDGRVVASQRWSKLTFLHWRVAASTLQHLMPAGVRPDEHDGSSWVGLIAFYLDRASIAGGPTLPFGSFAEVNVRLYGVDEKGRRGVVFLSLEASRLAAVLAAKVVFSIPYFWSATTIDAREDTITYTADRHHGPGEMLLIARPGTTTVANDSTADFLTARWALFATRRGKTIYLRNHHDPWHLRECELVTLQDTLLECAGFAGLADRPPDSVLYSDVVMTRFGSRRSGGR